MIEIIREHPVTRIIGGYRLRHFCGWLDPVELPQKHSIMELYKITARGLFGSLSQDLIAALDAAGFVVVGKLNLNNEEHRHFKYEVIVVDIPRLSSQMVRLNPTEGVILPACISLIETYPGEVSIVIANPTEHLAAENSQLLHFAKEITREMMALVRTFARDENAIPDLVTSWG